MSDEHFCDRLIGLYDSKLQALDDEIADLSSRRYRLADRLRQMRAQRASRFSERRGQHEDWVTGQVISVDGGLNLV